MIPLTIFEINIQSSFPLDYGANPGSAIRGALYEALRLIYDSEHEARSFTDETNPVAWLMRMSDPNAKGGESVPRPFGIRPPLPQQPNIFGIVLYGRACKYSTLMFSALDAMQIIGIGTRKMPFQIKRIFQIHPITHTKKIIAEEGKIVGELHKCPEPEVYYQAGASFDVKQIRIEFLTPTRIIHKERISYKPVFAHWITRLLSRIRKLSELYTEKSILIPFNELKALAWTIQLTDDNTRWQEAWSHSSKDKSNRPTSGYVGTVNYSGNLESFLPYLILGQSLQVGKNISKGNGWFQLIG